MNGKQLRDKGIEKVSIGKEEWIAAARKIAIQVAKRRGTVTVNDVRPKIELPKQFHPNTWGAVFRAPCFESLGYTAAAHPAAHARIIRVYQYIGE